MFSVVFILYLFISADVYGIISNKQIASRPVIEIKFYDNEIVHGKMIGKTNEVIFLLQGEKVSAIPITSLVKGIEIIEVAGK
jgi:hypothetical protein